MMGFPNKGWSGLGNLETIRVPFPAARTITSVFIGLPYTSLFGLFFLFQIK